MAIQKTHETKLQTLENSEEGGWFRVHHLNFTVNFTVSFMNSNSQPEDANSPHFSIPTLLEGQKLLNFSVPSFLKNPVKWFLFFRKLKKCTILVLPFEKGKTPIPYLLMPLAYFIIKKPGGPAILAHFKNGCGVGLRAKILKLFSDVSCNGDSIPIDALKRAFFVAECGHPSSIYKETIQQERINWLKQQAQGKILEVGCSTGFVLDYIGGGIGIDIDDLRLEYARSRYPKWSFLKMDAANTPFSDAEFDTVLIPDILEHVPFDHARQIVNESKRIAKRLVITVPNAEKPNYRKDLVENPDHVWFPKTEDVKTLLGEDCEIFYSRSGDFIYGISKGIEEKL